VKAEIPQMDDLQRHLRSIGDGAERHGQDAAARQTNALRQAPRPIQAVSTTSHASPQRLHCDLSRAPNRTFDCEIGSTDLDRSLKYYGYRSPSAVSFDMAIAFSKECHHGVYNGRLDAQKSHLAMNGRF
jgi:hypothetical protein